MLEEGTPKILQEELHLNAICASFHGGALVRFKVLCGSGNEVFKFADLAANHIKAGIPERHVGDVEIKVLS
jgi:hypothetical protein